MKKLLLAFCLVTLLSCSGMIRHQSGTFEYIAIPQPHMDNPTFSVFVDGYYPSTNSWLKGQIESALMHEKVAVISFTNSMQVVTATREEGKAIAAADGSGAAASEEKVDVTTTTGLHSIIKSDYLFHANYDNWTFSVVSMRNQEIVAKGMLTSLYVEDIQKNVSVILKEMRITQ